MALAQRAPYEIAIKNTFIHVTFARPCRPTLRRCKTDSTLFCALLAETSQIDVDGEASTSTATQADDSTIDTEPDAASENSISQQALAGPQRANIGEGGYDDCTTVMLRNLLTESSFDQHEISSVDGKTSTSTATGADDVATYTECDIEDDTNLGEEAHDDRTTVMLQNLPIEFTPEKLLELCDSNGLKDKYDFVFIPVDFQTGCWKGSAFMNCVSHEDALYLKECLQGVRRICTCSWGERMQGLDANVEHFRNLMHHASAPVC